MSPYVVWDVCEGPRRSAQVVWDVCVAGRWLCVSVSVCDAISQCVRVKQA